MELAPVFGLQITARRLPGLINKLDPLPTSIVAVLDRGAAAVMKQPLTAALEKTGLAFKVIPFLPGEKRKTLTQLDQLAQKMVRSGLDRGGLVIGVGGGITTDMAGFAASTYMRGVRWAALPTTLLGMADAAIGGKTAVNLPQGKNLLGAFHLPQFVLADVATLATLSDRDWRCGMGEVVKSGMIGSAALLRRLEKMPASAFRAADFAAGGRSAASDEARGGRRGNGIGESSVGNDMLAIARATAKVKCTVVEQDPLEHGVRKLLNLGHTFGHALETAAGPRKLAHGEAVALGLRCALDMAVDVGVATSAYRDRMAALLEHVGLGMSYPGRLPSQAELSKLLARDKKKAKHTVDVILPLKPGLCEILPGQKPRDLARRIHASLG
jgi:3-dehydroquinate synthase